MTSFQPVDFQSAKAVVRAFHEDLDSAGPDDAAEAMATHCSAALLWRGVHPFYEQTGPEAAAHAFWAPLKRAFTALQRRDDIFFAGANAAPGAEDAEGSVWVAAAGHHLGLFDAPWLGVRPTGRIAVLRACAFHRVVGDRIAETALHVDIPHLMAQADQSPFAPQTAAAASLGPQTQDGLLYGAQDAAEGAATLATIEGMIADLGQWRSGLPLETELRRSWREDMLWWGPAGIGAAYTIPRYAEQHAGPFRAGFADRSPTRHVARVAEGRYGGFFGWPNFTARPTGGFMGMPATGRPGAFHVFDLYRRDGDKLAENWIYIDLLRFWFDQGVDLLERNRRLGPDGAVR